ncbi:uncharacterized protein LOC122294083 [Carya illinoinensis]|uniref:uncharacterized protein LOC122294083 n=1 Tax=Carya illinoinensis TaxID=32201 RepID=UPI001C718126|nr:uncharacterized protein LOC122294083 [Carya illinoinensis]
MKGENCRFSRKGENHRFKPEGKNRRFKPKGENRRPLHCSFSLVDLILSQKMEKEKEDASRITPPITNPSTLDISRPLYSGISNYMPSYNSPTPHAWLPPFMPYPSANSYPWSNQVIVGCNTYGTLLPLLRQVLLP